MTSFCLRTHTFFVSTASLDRPGILNRGRASPGGVNLFQGGHELLRLLQHGKFLNEKMFRLIYLFKVRGA